ncbi:11767_t:CDS:1, partial [Gigaspora rosea]
IKAENIFICCNILKTLIQTKVLKLPNSNEYGCPLSRYELLFKKAYSLENLTS